MADSPTESEIELAAKNLRRNGMRAVYLKRADFPASTPLRSYFGGMPRLRPRITWPIVKSVDDTDIEPTFLLQIQLEELPDFTGRGALPKTGVLYFFADTNFEGNGEPSCCVLYDDGDAATFSETQPPNDLMLLSSYLDYTNHFWLSDDEPLAKRDFRYPVELVAFTSYRDWDDEPSAHWDLNTAHQHAYGRLQIEALEEVFGPREVRESQWLSDETWEGWPWSNGCLEHCARAFVWTLKEYVDQEGWRGKRTPEDARKLYERLTTEANAWRGRALPDAPGEALPHEASDGFRRWWNEALGAIHAAWSATDADGKHIIRQDACSDAEVKRRCDQARLFALKLALSDAASCDPQVADQAKRILIRIGWRWTRDPNHDSGMRAASIVMHQMLGYGQSVQSAPIEHQDDVLLLQIAGDDGLAWHSNIGCTLQFWIAPSDLKVRRFDRVRATLECD